MLICCFIYFMHFFMASTSLYDVMIGGPDSVVEDSATIEMKFLILPITCFLPVIDLSFLQFLLWTSYLKN
jgi:hypothetical protein